MFAFFFDMCKCNAWSGKVDNSAAVWDSLNLSGKEYCFCICEFCIGLKNNQKKEKIGNNKQWLEVILKGLEGLWVFDFFCQSSFKGLQV